MLLKPSRGRLLPFYSSTAVSLYEIYTIHISIEVSGKKRRGGGGAAPPPAAGLCPHIQLSGMVTASSSRTRMVSFGCQTQSCSARASSAGSASG